MPTQKPKKPTKPKKAAAAKSPKKLKKPTKPKKAASSKAALKSKAAAKSKPAAEAKKATKPKMAASAKRSTKPKTRPAARKKALPRAAEPQVLDNPLGGETILTPEQEQPLISTNSGADWDYNPDPQVLETLVETEQPDDASKELVEELQDYRATSSPVLSAGDIDADWERAEAVGEEAVGGTVSTPDQDRVDEIGQALGITYQDEEPLNTEAKLERRDRKRWELNPASDDEQ